MYCGEVNVKHDALPAFISTAEALQIKGLTETVRLNKNFFFLKSYTKYLFFKFLQAEATTTSSSIPTKVSTPAPSVSTSSPRSRTQRNVSRTSYKLESEDSSDERPAPPPQTQTQKRAAQRSITPQAISAAKRIKNQDPLEAAEPTQEIIPDKSEEPEFIDLPIETMPTKSEPEYADDSAEVEEGGDQEASYVEDDSYGDMKYDESYFTENDESKPGVSGFNENYTTEGDTSAQEAQG